jgi:hypothetical protein
MTIKIFSLPRLVLARYTKEKGRFLEHMTCEAGEPYANVIVMNDYEKDSRINLIKFMTDEKEKAGSLYYSETKDGKKIITLNLGSKYKGKVFSKNYAGEDIANAEQWTENILREKHIERIDKLDNIKADLNPEKTAEKYKVFFYSLNRFV